MCQLGKKTGRLRRGAGRPEARSVTAGEGSGGVRSSRIWEAKARDVSKWETQLSYHLLLRLAQGVGLLFRPGAIR
jgi:hypothetical protein